MNGADLVVVGAGLAGLSAALEAAQAGLDVLVIEKEEAIGGSSVISSGFFAFAGTDRQQAGGIADTEELYYDDLREVGQLENDEALVRAFVTRQLATYEWLKACGVAFGRNVEAVAGQSVPRVHTVDPRQAVDALAARCAESKRISIRVGTPATRLLRDPAGDRIAGVHATSGASAVVIQAAAGVVLTSGGFVHDQVMIHRCAPGYDQAIRLSGPGNVGDGLRMARAEGADFRDMAWIKGTYGKHPHDATNNNACLAIYKGAIAVNGQGERFVDESLSYKLVGDAALRQPGGVTYQILDQDIFATGDDGMRVYDFARRVATGLMLRADTLDELAARIGVPADALARTIDEYNVAAVKGVDDAFGRRHLVHTQGRLRPLVKPPFYAYPSGVVIFATYCGLCVDAGMRVLDVYGLPIEGLYAAGEITGGFHGVTYMTGTSLAKAAVFGRVAAREAAARVARA